MKVPRVCLLASAVAVAALSQPAFFRDTEVNVVGEIAYGQTSEPFVYTPKPPYRAVHFQGTAGDKIDIKVESTDGQAMIALTDSAYKPVASTFGSELAAVLPASPEPYPKRYFIIFQEARGHTATFTVTLQKAGVVPAAAGQDYLSCKVDSDCVVVPREGCCHNGYNDAVNKDRIAAYRAANACKLKNPMCAQFIVTDNRVARCNTTTHQCEMVQPPAK